METVIGSAATDPAADLWSVRVFWKPAPGVSCPEYTTFIVKGETQAIDSAVLALDGCRHRWAPVKAAAAQVRRAGDSGAWRAVTVSRSYL